VEALRFGGGDMPRVKDAGCAITSAAWD